MSSIRVTVGAPENIFTLLHVMAYFLTTITVEGSRFPWKNKNVRTAMENIGMFVVRFQISPQ